MLRSLPQTTLAIISVSWASDQLFLGYLFFICRYVHGLSTISTCQRGKHRLRKRSFWNGDDNQCYFLAYYRKTRVHGPG